MDAIEIYFGKMVTNHTPTKSNYVKVKMIGLCGQLSLWH